MSHCEKQSHPQSLPNVDRRRLRPPSSKVEAVRERVCSRGFGEQHALKEQRLQAKQSNHKIGRSVGIFMHYLVHFKSSVPGSSFLCQAMPQVAAGRLTQEEKADRLDVCVNATPVTQVDLDTTAFTWPILALDRWSGSETRGSQDSSQPPNGGTYHLWRIS